MSIQQPTFIPSKIEDIDIALFEYIDQFLNIQVNTFEGLQKVPIVFSTPERSWLSKGSKDSHDEKYSLKYPIISIKRGDFTKPKAKDGTLQGNVFTQNPFAQSIPIYTTINHQKTAERANSDSKKYAGTLNSKKSKNKRTTRTIYNIYKIPVPTFIEIDYEISMISNFQTQMNNMLAPFLKSARNSNWFKLIRNGHGYECFYDEKFTNKSNIDDFSEEERKFEYSFGIKIKGYIHDGDIGDKGPAIIKVENQPELVFKAKIIESGEFPK